MPPPRSPTNRPHRVRAFTLAELMLYTALAAALASVSFKTMLNFMEERRLRSAAIELVGYLEIARNTASAANIPCVIKIISDNTGEFGPDASQSGNACRGGTVIPTLKLRTLSGSNNLRVRVISATGYPLSFNPEGTTTSGATVLLSTSDVPSGGWCVDVQSPLATVRRGWLASGANVCNYAVEQ